MYQSQSSTYLALLSSFRPILTCPYLFLLASPCLTGFLSPHLALHHLRTPYTASPGLQDISHIHTALTQCTDTLRLDRDTLEIIAIHEYTGPTYCTITTIAILYDITTNQRTDTSINYTPMHQHTAPRHCTLTHCTTILH